MNTGPHTDVNTHYMNMFMRYIIYIIHIYTSELYIREDILRLATAERAQIREGDRASKMFLSDTQSSPRRVRGAAAPSLF